jgi:hypothetical protein
MIDDVRRPHELNGRLDGGKQRDGFAHQLMGTGSGHAGAPSYVELLTCLEMARDAKKLKEQQSKWGGAARSVDDPLTRLPRKISCTLTHAPIIKRANCDIAHSMNGTKVTIITLGRSTNGGRGWDVAAKHFASL